MVVEVFALVAFGVFIGDSIGQVFFLFFFFFFKGECALFRLFIFCVFFKQPPEGSTASPGRKWLDALRFAA